MSSDIGVYCLIFSNVDKGVLIMASKQTSQRKKTTTAQTGTETKTENATSQISKATITAASKPGRPAASQNRKAKFYDDILNCRLRELMDGREARKGEWATPGDIGERPWGMR